MRSIFHGGLVDEQAPTGDILSELFSLRDRCALVTGASGGIGRELSIAFARAGAAVGIHGTDEARLSQTADLIARAGGRSVRLLGDVASPATCARLVAEAQQAWGRIDILVNCAGTNRRKPIRSVTPDDFDHIVHVNLRGVFFLSQAVHPVMQARGGGKIIHIGSIASSTGLGGVSVYGATKAAVAQLTRTMALEWARDNIQVNCLAPGFMFTPLTEQGLWGDAHRKKWLEERIPLRRPGQPAELIGAALLFASDASSYLTGQVLTVDGGFLAGGSWLRDDE